MSEAYSQTTVDDEPSDLILMRSQASTASQLLKSMGSENRLLILCMLCTGELSVGEINQRINLANQPFPSTLRYCAGTTW